MTLETAKRLYKHYIKTGQTESAEDMVKRRPQILEEEKVEPIKSKGKK